MNSHAAFIVLIHLIGVLQLSKQVFAHLMSVLNQLVGRCGNLTVSALVLQGSDFMIDFCV